ncbi:MAG: thioredoxin family protein [Candidatus Delongbacteria bacterium]|nr:thioredoxin family protein [Candidatus Delongbacteria bacterium]MCG2760428.1 thioredoxin family protein [Candidatus Delongbacteria bacterium]
MRKINYLIILFIFILSISACADNPKEQTPTVKETVKAEKPVETVLEKPVEEVDAIAKKQENFKVTFVELGSVNCIPCKQMQPIMKAIVEEYPTQVKVEFIDVWTQKGKVNSEKYKIRVIPTQVFLDSIGKEYFRHEGFFPKEELVKILKQKGVK